MIIGAMVQPSSKVVSPKIRSSRRVGVVVEIVGGMIVEMHPPIVDAVVVDRVRLRGMDIVLRGKCTTNVSHWILPLHMTDAYCFV